MDYTGTNFKSQFKAALKSNSKYVIIIGEAELSNKVVSIKNTRNPGTGPSQNRH